ncbi:HtaA domain-containing protein [Leifsonia sp. H3M29-4]|uniref:HtaA domain-containing protein n=1 Tax=Salinibacterium metalliresistens TaxID=3031321 RepID=UPI0023DCA9BD|nr:HtaA domain-containing protein [Salinibacterium metalliresistens]MDF1478172.1 HtaA domain-containing protein [Salinibacterium metalliresistens]
MKKTVLTRIRTRWGAAAVAVLIGFASVTAATSATALPLRADGESVEVLVEPTATPEAPAEEPAEELAAEPTTEPTAEPTAEPTEEPTTEPATEPVEEPATDEAPEALVPSADLFAASRMLSTMSTSATDGSVADATLSWGIKTSFTNYISGPIAHGGWTVAGNVSSSTPFAWTGGEGSADVAADTGSVLYDGSIHFTGHGGLLDLTFSDFRVERTGPTTGSIVVDAVYTEMSNPGVFIPADDVVLATLDLSSGTETSTSESVAFSGVPAVLTADGAAAFAGFYSAGAALDAVSFEWPVEAAAATPTITVSPSTNLDRTGQTVTVTGSGYAGTKAIYVTMCEDRELSTVSFAMLTTSSCLSTSSARLVTPSPTSATQVKMEANGTFSFEYAVPAAASSFTAPAFFTLMNHTGMTDRTQDAKRVVAFAGTTTPTDPGTPTNPGTPTTPTTPPTAGVSLGVTPSSVDRSVSNTFRISGSGYTGAGAANGVYVSIGSSSVWQPGRVPSESGWLATVWVQPGSISGGAFSTSITIPANAFVAGGDYGVATFAAHGLALTNRSLDAWSPISLGGATGPASVGSSVRSPAAAPPQTDGIAAVDADEFTEGQRYTFTAEGFQPNESGILVVLYSTPTVIDRAATADQNGVVTWTGKLPYGLSGDHTLTFQGSVSRGLALQIQPMETQGCTVEASSLTWGFKESFRSYISGSIANGEWTVADGATYETPNFGWADGEGHYDPATGEGVLAFQGSIEFTGHGGILDTTVANPVIEFVDADSAVLLLDVSGTTQEGTPVEAAGVEFAGIDLASATVTQDGAVLTVTDAPATLSAPGAAAFGTYPAGEELDPLTFTITLDGACATTSAPVEVDPENTAATGPDLGWLAWLIVGIVVVGAAAGVLIWRMRARKA